MAAIRHLTRAPIVEAILDFRVGSLDPDFQPEAFLSLKDRLREHYPVAEERRFFQASFEFREGKAMPPEEKFGGLQGYNFKSEDGRNVAQFRVDGFTYNRLAPYTSLDEIRPAALDLWGLYVELAKPEKLDRLALRYINRIAIPSKGTLAEYFQVLPTHFPGSPKYLATFVTRISSHDPDTGYFANVGQALERGVDPLLATVTIDIDVYRVSDLAVESQKLVPIIEGLRKMKNEIFFGAITEATAELYS